MRDEGDYREVMRRRKLEEEKHTGGAVWVWGIGFLVVLGGCVALVSASGEDNNSPPRTTETEPTEGVVGQDIDATNRSNYGIAYDLCTEFTPEQMAAEFAVPSNDPNALANAYADGHTDRSRQAGYEGCIDTVLGQPDDPTPRLNEHLACGLHQCVTARGQQGRYPGAATKYGYGRTRPRQP